MRIDIDHSLTTFQPCSRRRGKKTELPAKQPPLFRFSATLQTTGVTILFLLSLFLVFLSPSFLALLKTSFYQRFMF
ncbi:hypothetical protein [Phascolarctobacterium sp.]